MSSRPEPEAKFFGSCTHFKYSFFEKFQRAKQSPAKKLSHLLLQMHNLKISKKCFHGLIHRGKIHVFTINGNLRLNLLKVFNAILYYFTIATNIFELLVDIDIL